MLQVVTMVSRTRAKPRALRRASVPRAVRAGDEGADSVEDAVDEALVFTGAIEETGRRFARGDLATRERGEQHEQRIAGGELCVALVVNEGPLVPLTLRGRLLLALSRD